MKTDNDDALFSSLFYFPTNWKGVKPVEFLARSLAPEATKYLAISVCVLCTAVCNGVLPGKYKKGSLKVKLFLNWGLVTHR